MNFTKNRLDARPNKRRRLARFLSISTIVLILAYGILILAIRPSNDRDWNLDQMQLAQASVLGDALRIDNVRHARYRSSADFDVHWETRHYDLRQLESLWYVVEPFADWRGPAHTFLSFGFGQGQYLAVSVEIRKEKGEAFSPLMGLLRQYEIAYVIGDERDLIGLRANHRKDAVYLYKMRAKPQQIRALLLSMLDKANQLTTEPEFYNTLTNTCTSSIVEHIALIAPGHIPWSYRTLLPGYSDDFAYDLGLIDTSLARDQFRAHHQINSLAKQFADQADFSERIRGH